MWRLTWLTMLLIFMPVSAQATGAELPLIGSLFISGHPNSAQETDFVDKPIAVLETSDQTWQVKWNPNGRILAVATDDGLKLYDQQLQLISHVLNDVTLFGLSWRPDGEQIAFTNGNNVEVWSWDDSAEILAPYAQLTGKETQIAVFWSPDGERIASIGSFECKDEIFCLSHIILWNATNYQFIEQLPNQYVFQFEYAAYPSGERISWSKNGQPLLAIVGNTMRQEGTEYFSNSNLSVFIVNAETGITIKQFEISRIYGLSVDWRPGTSEIVVGGVAGADVYDANTGNMIIYSSAFIERPTVVAWSPNGRYIVADNQIFDTLNDSQIGNFGSVYSPITLDWHPNGYLLAQGGGKRIEIDDARLLPGFAASLQEVMTPSATVETRP